MQGIDLSGSEPTSVVLITDCIDVAVVEMRLAIDAAYRKAGGRGHVLQRVEPPVLCDAYSITNAAFLTRLVAELAAPGTIIMVIANPMKQRPERIFGRTKTGVLFEGPNTGAFGWLAHDQGIAECVEIHDPGFVPFGGKYVHAPAVGRYLAGAPLSELGTAFEHDKVRGTLPTEAEVVHIDNFGNAKMFATTELLKKSPSGQKVTVRLPDQQIIDAHYAVRMMERNDGDWVLYPGSSMGLLELGQVRHSGFLGSSLRAGQVLAIEEHPAS